MRIDRMCRRDCATTSLRDMLKHLKDGGYVAELLREAQADEAESGEDCGVASIVAVIKEVEAAAKLLASS